LFFSIAAAASATFCGYRTKITKKLVGSVKKQINYQWSGNVPSSHFSFSMPHGSHFYSFANLLDILLYQSVWG
jgi:hypothetical protein